MSRADSCTLTQRMAATHKLARKTRRRSKLAKKQRKKQSRLRPQANPIIQRPNSAEQFGGVARLYRFFGFVGLAALPAIRLPPGSVNAFSTDRFFLISAYLCSTQAWLRSGSAGVFFT